MGKLTIATSMATCWVLSKRERVCYSARRQTCMLYVHCNNLTLYINPTENRKENIPLLEGMNIET